MGTSTYAPSIEDILSGIPDGERRSLAEAVLRRSVSLLTRLLSEASPEVLIASLSAPTNVGTLALLLSSSGLQDLENAVKEIDPLADAFARGAEAKDRLLQEAGGGWSAERVAEHLGISPEEVERRRQANALLAVNAAGGPLYPGLQFTSRGVVPRFEEILAAFQVSGSWTRLSVLLSGTPRLPGMRVIDALQRGFVDEAVHAVSTFGEHGAV